MTTGITNYTAGFVLNTMKSDVGYSKADPIQLEASVTAREENVSWIAGASSASVASLWLYPCIVL